MKSKVLVYWSKNSYSNGTLKHDEKTEPDYLELKSKFEEINKTCLTNSYMIYMKENVKEYMLKNPGLTIKD